MSQVRRTPTGATAEQVLAAAVAQLAAEVADLRSTLLARTSATDSLVLLDSNGARWRVTVSTAGALTTAPA